MTIPRHGEKEAAEVYLSPTVLAAYGLLLRPLLPRPDGVPLQIQVNGRFYLTYEMGHPVCIRFMTIPRHGEEEEAEVEGEGRGGASRDGDADAHDVAQVEVLRHEGVEDEPL